MPDTRRYLGAGVEERLAWHQGNRANYPKVFLMEEPLGALDAPTDERMQGLVLKLWEETSKTIIVITHPVEEALLLGEQLLVAATAPILSPWTGR